MPFYEYECQACKYYTEVMQKISDAPLTKCPSCGKRRLVKLVSAPVFRLKGAGWYETDFKSDKENRRNLLGADKEEAKAESKPDTKEAKDEAKTGKESKDAKESKPAEPKSAEAKPASAGASAKSARRSVSVSGKASRAARKPARSGRGRRTRRGRR
jgi:putative FmdB family regulatory protein